MPVLPQNIVERLGVPDEPGSVTYAGEHKEERPIADPLTIHVCKRASGKFLNDIDLGICLASTKCVDYTRTIHK